MNLVHIGCLQAIFKILKLFIFEKCFKYSIGSLLFSNITTLQKYKVNHYLSLDLFNYLR